MVKITSCLTSPGSVKQVSGVEVAVGGIGLGVKVFVGVASGGRVLVGVGMLSFGVEEGRGVYS